MGFNSQALQNQLRQAVEGSEPPAPKPERTPTPERRVPAARDTLSTLPEQESDDDFEPHDTIPAPPWLGDL